MPSTSAKPLHVAKSLSSLIDMVNKTKADFKTKPTHLLVSSAGKLFEAAEKNSLDKDEETAYTLFMRFVEIVLYLKSKKDFEKNSNYNKLMRNVNTAIVKAENLKKSLKNRYTKSNEETAIKTKNDKNELLSSLHNKTPGVSAEDDITNNIKSLILEEKVEVSISSSKLFSLLTPTSKILLMDIRPEKDFEESHIKHSCCINVPEDILNPGVTAATLERLLPSASLESWHKRGDVDFVILIGWNCKDASKPSLHMNALKEAMCKWDQKCSLKKAPLILHGGYKDWMLKYPMHTTQALNFLNSDSKTSPVVADISDIEYPNLEENVGERNKENINGPGPLFTKTAGPVPTLNNISLSFDSKDPRKAKSAPAFDRKAKPNEIPTSANPQIMTRNFGGPNLTNDSKMSSNLKSLSSENSNKNKHENATHLESLLKEELLAKDSLDIAREQLLKEQEFEKLCLRKEKEAEESKRIEIQKQEGILLEKLKQLDQIMSEKDTECEKFKEDNMKMKKLLDEFMDKEVQSKKEKEILTTEKEKKILQEQVKKLREERKMKEAKKKFEQKSEVLPRNAISANSSLKRPVNNHDQTDALNSDHTVPLSRQSSSDSGGRGLMRSHSSPNIAQLLNQEESNSRNRPVIDRSLKPTVANSYSSEINRARFRNLNPVYGNCPATGLRNLGNTCFMNSVIQCLANTIPLVNYFISNEYVCDINRDSRQNGEVVEEFAVVLQSLWRGQYKSFSPKDFKNTVSKCLSVCIGNEQQDSHEFFVVLMEKLHSDLNRRAVKSIPKLDPSHDEGAFWQHHKSYNDSIVSDIFEGLLKSTLTCLTCQKTSDSFEVFSCLSLPILTSKCSLQDCFKNFLKSEKISGEAAWECPRCKQKKEAEKKLRICQLPDILTIQLKRFSYEGLWRRKLQTHVDFDISFDVPYERNGEKRYRKYTLYGIVNHYGTLEGGHYIAFCNAQSSKWYKYDDHEVSDMSLSDIKTSAAYMLFYHANDLRSSS